MVERMQIEHWLYSAAGSTKGLLFWSDNPHGLVERFRSVRAALREPVLADLEFRVVELVDANVLVRKRAESPGTAIVASPADLGL